MQCSALQEFVLKDCCEVTTLLVAAPRLRNTSLARLVGLRDATLECDCLNELKLDCCRHVERVSVTSLLLRRLNLSFCGEVQALTLECSALRRLNLSYCKQLFDLDVSGIATPRPVVLQGVAGFDNGVSCLAPAHTHWLQPAAGVYAAVSHGATSKGNSQ